MNDQSMQAALGIIRFSQFIDDKQPNDEALTLVRLAKIAEQAGETLGDYIRAEGRNILKEDYSVTVENVAARVLSTAFSALAVYEHLTGHSGNALPDLFALVERMQQNEVAEPPSGV